MRKIIFLITVILMISGCNVFKSRQYSKLETKSEVRRDSIGLIIDKSITTVIEKVDTFVTTQEKVIKENTHFNMDSLVNGMTAIKNDVLDLRLVLNPVTGILSAEAIVKASKVPVKINRETIKQNDIAQQSNVIEEKKESTKQESGSSVVRKEVIKLWWYFGLAAVLFLIWFMKR